MQNRSEPCIWDKYTCQSGTDRQKGGVFALSASGGQRSGSRQFETRKLNIKK